MKRPVSTLHTLLLLASMILLAGIGLLFAIAPGSLLERMGLSASDQVLGVLRVASAAVLAEAVAIAIALASRSREAIRIVTILLVIHFTVETIVRGVNFADGASDSVVAAVPQAALGMGLLVMLVKDLSAGAMVAGRDRSADGSSSIRAS